jgi:hypothetical protein
MAWTDLSAVDTRMRHVLGRRQQSDNWCTLPCGHRLSRAFIPPASWTALIIVAIRRRCATCRCSPDFLYSLNSARTWPSSQPIRSRSQMALSEFHKRLPAQSARPLVPSPLSGPRFGGPVRGGRRPWTRPLETCTTNSTEMRARQCKAGQSNPFWV